jgi:hypothetical protein
MAKLQLRKCNFIINSAEFDHELEEWVERVIT